MPQWAGRSVSHQGAPRKRYSMVPSKSWRPANRRSSLWPSGRCARNASQTCAPGAPTRPGESLNSGRSHEASMLRSPSPWTASSEQAASSAVQSLHETTEASPVQGPAQPQPSSCPSRVPSASRSEPTWSASASLELRTSASVSPMRSSSTTKPSNPASRIDWIRKSGPGRLTSAAPMDPERGGSVHSSTNASLSESVPNSTRIRRWVT